MTTMPKVSTDDKDNNPPSFTWRVHSLQEVRTIGPSHSIIWIKRGEQEKPIALPPGTPPPDELLVKIGAVATYQTQFELNFFDPNICEEMRAALRSTRGVKVTATPKKDDASYSIRPISKT